MMKMILFMISISVSLIYGCTEKNPNGSCTEAINLNCGMLDSNIIYESSICESGNFKINTFSDTILILELSDKKNYYLIKFSHDDHIISYDLYLLDKIHTIGILRRINTSEILSESKLILKGDKIFVESYFQTFPNINIKDTNFNVLDTLIL